MIKITHLRDHGVSNSNYSQLIEDPTEILRILGDSEEWTDDLEFYGDDGNTYSIDDLTYKHVCVDDVEVFVEPHRWS